MISAHFFCLNVFLCVSEKCIVSLFDLLEDFYSRNMMVFDVSIRRRVALKNANQDIPFYFFSFILFIMKKFILILLSVLLLLGIAYFWGQKFLNKKITSTVEQVAEQNGITYSNFVFSLGEGSVRFDSVVYYTEKDSFRVEQLVLSGFDYLSYLSNKKIDFKYLKLLRPEITLAASKDTAETQEKKEPPFDLENEIKIKDIHMEEGIFTFWQDSSKSLHLRRFDFDLKDLFLDQNTLKEKIPFTYHSLLLKGDSLSYPLDPLQTLKVHSFDIDDHNATFRDLQILPNYSRSEYVKVIPYEKDLIDMRMKHVSLHDYSLDLTGAGLLEINKIVIDTMQTQIYRDKLVRDDQRNKEMYSQMLRDLDLKVNIDTLQMKDSELSYEEVQEKTKEVGKVFFQKMNVLATSITNKDLEQEDFPQTVVDISCLLMGTSPMKTVWKFKVNDPADRFQIGGSIQQIPVASINNFFEPGFNMRAEGDPIKSITFNFSGDKYQAGGPFNMTYDNLKITILKKDKKEKKGLLSFVANIFVSHKSEKKEGKVQVSNVSRDPKRSFWNYFWQCMFEGIQQTLV